MNRHRSLTPGNCLAAALIAVSVAASGPSRADEGPVPLALVGADTVTTTDLRVELTFMNARNTNNVPTKLDDPAAILKRLTENQLLVQEGFRIGLDQAPVVRNPAWDAVRHECMKALLDSVALSIPEGAPGVHDARRAAVKTYLDRLAALHGVTVDSTLLRSLDYGSEDVAVQKRLLESPEVLVRMRQGRPTTVADFTRVLRFTEFHGLVGKPDAATRRDDILREHVAEIVVGRQVRAQKMDQTPQMRFLYQQFERSAMLEEVLKVISQLDFAPSDADVSHYYREHVAEFTASPRVKMASVRVSTKDIADELYQRVLKGASVHWLSSNDKRVAQGAPPFPEEWLQPEQLGLKTEDLKLGYAPEPYQVPEGWVVAQVSDLESGQPLQLEKCRDRVLARMRQQAARAQLIDSLARLEAESPIVILPGAEAAVTRVVAETQGDAARFEKAGQK